MKPTLLGYHCFSLLHPTKPFAFDATVYKPGHFPSSDTKWEPGKRWQTMRWHGLSLGLILEDVGKVSKPAIRLHIFSQDLLQPTLVAEIANEVNWRFNLSLDLNTFYARFEDDEYLGPVIKSLKGMRPISPQSLYEYLIIAVVLQNATVRRSVQMMEALFQHYGEPVEFDGLVFNCFWDPGVLAKATEQNIRELKVGYRAKTISKISQQFADARIDESKLRGASRTERYTTILGLYGVGPASLGYIMFDVFHDWSYLDHISPWEQKIYTRLWFGQDFTKELVAARHMLDFFALRYGEWKALAVNYVWEDMWWRRVHGGEAWLDELIRL